MTCSTHLQKPCSQCGVGQRKAKLPRSLCSFQMNGLQGKQCPLSTLPSSSQGSTGMGIIFLSFLMWCLRKPVDAAQSLGLVDCKKCYPAFVPLALLSSLVSLLFLFLYWVKWAFESPANIDFRQFNITMALLQLEKASRTVLNCSGLKGLYYPCSLTVDVAACRQLRVLLPAATNSCSLCLC